MTTEKAVHEAARLRFRFQMNNRLRLESLAALSRVFRDFGEPIEDELLASMVFAVPEELIGEYSRFAEMAAAKRPPTGGMKRPGAPKKKRPPTGGKKPSKKRPPTGPPPNPKKKRPPKK
jgi:hypothetical protein